MHFYSCRNKLYCVFLLLALTILATGCLQKKEEQKSESNNIQSHGWTDTIIGSWYIRIHSPEPGEHPGIWEGPLEIGDKPGTFFCKIDTSLIKGVRQGIKNDILVIEAFSGSEVFEVTIDIDSCKAESKQVKKND